jgi:hypothetical protein
MKRIILSLSIVLTCATAVFASDVPGDNEAAKKVFDRVFRGAEHVSWTTQDDYTRATFVIGGHRTEAWFSAEGELLGTARDIFFTQLPLVVMRSVDKRFEGASIFETREISNLEGTRYRLTLEHKGKKYKLAVYPDGNFDEVEKIKK